ncbi:glutamate racemase [Candidatus Kaiserbacteria bacterium RIFCSPHIGHO2_01_FULL_46_22]|uniref:Glutamate racemase n=1 Tax=Candidatus Kaiserbacteria bacterium RIFCSPHIGHO2_01_FULL_46_22 TaxID=1798475 RepID=A0A1F6BYL1_9BACT|nr:MAG: glutamate racemase [Candidatus Kaiserbacteria bacterium RIFCSPHIGHO2_01_FULL_46_22]
MNGSNDGKIGLFDSGLGGLTILKAVAKDLPLYDYVFFGDTEHLPLGDKTEEEIYSYTKAGVEELFRRDCSLVIIACNTASAETLRRLQDTFLATEYPERRILGVIIPTIEELIDSGAKSALLLATKRTIESSKYEKELEKSGSNITLHSVATPELVPMIEEGKLDEAAEAAVAIIKVQIERVGEIDTIVLGCTHYTKLKDALRRAYGVAPTILSQDEIIPHKLTSYLDNHPEIESYLSRNSTRSIHLSSHRPDYDQIAAELLGGVMM